MSPRKVYGKIIRKELNPAQICVRSGNHHQETMFGPAFVFARPWSQICSPLRRPRCRCTSSSRGTCWPGTSGRFYTAASSSAPSSRKCLRYQCLSPDACTQAQRKLINHGLWRSQKIMGLWRRLFSHLLWIWMAEGLIFLTLLLH